MVLQYPQAILTSLVTQGKIMTSQWVIIEGPVSHIIPPTMPKSLETQGKTVMSQWIMFYLQYPPTVLKSLATQGKIVTSQWMMIEGPVSKAKL